MRRWNAIAAIVALSASVIWARTAIDAAGQAQVRWYLGNTALNAQGQSLNLGDREQAVPVVAGWSCVVGPTSKNLPVYEARTTICEKGAEAFQFVVQCEPRREKDHTQIAFLNSERRPKDFIEVGCELH